MGKMLLLFLELRPLLLLNLRLQQLLLRLLLRLQHPLGAQVKPPRDVRRRPARRR